EKLPGYQEDSVIIMGAEDSKEFQSIMDVELTEVKAVEKTGKDSRGDTYTYIVYEYTDKPDLMMSPWVKSTLRNPKLLNIDADTNWWPDSLVRITGQVDKDRVVLLIQADKTPAFENNSVPVTPIYMGRLESYGNDDTIADALW
ncbi:hypothetical protein VJ282_37060, partial [Bacillus mycoides]